jgi:hypothetical protein
MRGTCPREKGRGLVDCTGTMAEWLTEVFGMMIDRKILVMMTSLFVGKMEKSRIKVPLLLKNGF